MTLDDRIRLTLDGPLATATFARGGGGGGGGSAKGKAGAKAKEKKTAKGGLGRGSYVTNRCCKTKGGKFAPGNNWGAKGGGSGGSLKAGGAAGKRALGSLVARTRAAAGAKAAAATRSQAARVAVETRTTSTKADRAGAIGRMVARSKEAAAKADPLSHVEAARVQQRVANAAAARAKPVHDLDRPSQQIGLYKKDIEANAQRIRDTEREAERLRPEYEKMKEKFAEAYRKTIDYNTTAQTRNRWEKKLKELRPEYDRLTEAVAWAPDRVKSFQNQAKYFEDKLAAAIADPKNRPTLEYGKLQARFPDLIPPGPITQRIAAYKVGDAKVKAVVAIGAKYEKMGVDLKARKEAHDKVIRENMMAQSTLIDPYASRSLPLPPDVKAKIEALQKKVDAEVTARRDVFAKESWLGDRQRVEVERVLRVKDGADIAGPDVPAGYKDGLGREYSPLHKGLRERADAATAWMNRNVARGDESTANVPLGDGGDAQRANHGYKHIALGTHSNQSTVVHEFGHAIDSRFKTGPDYVSARSREFLAHRVGDEPLTNLNEKFGGYDAHEQGRSDKFHEAFGGGSSAYYVGKHYESGTTEILSMGMQKVYDDPVGFARKDPEYFKFVAGIMDGSLR